MTNREQIEQAVISAGAFNGNDTDELLSEISKVYEKADALDEIKEYTLDKIEMLTLRQEYAPRPSQFEYFGNLLTVFKAIKIKINELERGE
ncbi:hypothetical protein 10S14_62 [uncultured Caudovirales phage]|uniref:Uncharacterized protein n=1 Tax=uncultured Caudovirales phage TaxID=2100421 RepID=A0A2H4J2P4_9CAUD|nr:hypothetical protein 10S14_62 [uncultured Caudovirales phage]